MRELSDIKPCEIAVYARVSTEEQVRHKEGSITTQVQRCKDSLAAEGISRLQLSEVRVFMLL